MATFTAPPAGPQLVVLAWLRVASAQQAACAPGQSGASVRSRARSRAARCASWRHARGRAPRAPAPPVAARESRGGPQSRGARRGSCERPRPCALPAATAPASPPR
eukprot:5116936-Prymnesium_polylepis.1